MSADMIRVNSADEYRRLAGGLEHLPPARPAAARPAGLAPGGPSDHERMMGAEISYRDTRRIGSQAMEAALATLGWCAGDLRLGALPELAWFDGRVVSTAWGAFIPHVGRLTIWLSSTLGFDFAGAARTVAHEAWHAHEFEHDLHVPDDVSERQARTYAARFWDQVHLQSDARGVVTIFSK